MTFERDIRDPGRRQPAPARTRAAAGVAPARGDDLKAAARRRGQGANALTGTRAVLAAPDPAGGAEVDTTVERAAACLEAATAGPARRGPEALEMVPDADVVRTSAGTEIVHFHQQHRGIPVFEAVRSVHLGPGGRHEMVGDHVRIAGELEAVPSISAAGAVMAAARYLAETMEAGPGGEPLEVSPYRPRLTVSFPLPSRPSVLAKPPFAEPVTAHLAWLHCGPGDTRLGWLTSLTLPGDDDQIDLIVAGGGEGTGEILYCKRSYLCARGRARVFPHSPGVSDRAEVELPLPRQAYPAFDAAGPSDPFGRPWIAKRNTRGNNAAAFRGNRRSTLEGERRDGGVRFAPADPRGEDQRLLNAFYFCNYLHDFFALLGFGEAEGSFQKENFTGVPGDRDALEIRIFDTPVAGTARMRSRRDGRAGELQLGPRGERHGALDADLVFHEYAHGVSTRLAGGRLSFEPLRHPESRALGEGYSDYFALTIQSHQLGKEKAVFGAWLGDDESKGLRRQAYDGSFDRHYGDLAEPENHQPHHGGEIWCAALMRMNRALGRALGDAGRGHEIGWQLVVDSLKLLPVGPDQPGFLDARDAVTRALADLGAAGRLDAADHAAVEGAVLQAFARTGMGPAAAGRGARFQGIVPDFSGAEADSPGGDPNELPGDSSPSGDSSHLSPSGDSSHLSPSGGTR